MLGGAGPVQILAAVVLADAEYSGGSGGAGGITTGCSISLLFQQYYNAPDTIFSCPV